MIASHTAVSSSLTSLPAFETEHTLHLAEQNLVPTNHPSYGHSAALQALADAYVNRRAGDRGDNLVRAAALLARAASFPANKQPEKEARAAALSRLGRALLARSQLDLRFIHADNTDIIDPTQCAAPKDSLAAHPESNDTNTTEATEATDTITSNITPPEEKASKPTKSEKSDTSFPEVPSYIQLARNPNPNVSRVAQKALLASTAAAEAVAASTPNFGMLKAAFESAEQSASATPDEKTPVSSPSAADAALASLGDEFTVLRNTLAALHVDRARALIVGASPGGAKDSTVAKRVKESMNALKLASKLRVPNSKRQKAAGALADIQLATLYSRTRGKSGDGSENFDEADRVRAARLFRGATATLVTLFAGGGSSSDTESTISTTPPTSPMKAKAAEGSDCSEGSISGSPKTNGNSNSKNSTNDHGGMKIPPQDPFEPFADWDLDEVRSFVDEESKRLGPVMQEGEGRRSCTLF